MPAVTMAPKKSLPPVKPTPEANRAPDKSVALAEPTPEAVKTTPGQLASPAEPGLRGETWPYRSYVERHVRGAFAIHDGLIFDFTLKPLRGATMEAGGRLSFSESVPQHRNAT